MKFNSAIIRYSAEKFKSSVADDTIYITGLLLVIGIGSFGLGRLSVVGEATAANPTTPLVQLMASGTRPTPVTMTESSLERGQASLKNAAAVVLSESPKPALTGPYVASKSGSKYYLVSCSGVKRIKEENKIFFASVHDAVASGYSPAANCPGL